MDNLIINMIERDAGKTVIELRMGDGSIRRFYGRPSETAEVHRLGGGPVRLLVVQDASEFKKPNAEALRDQGPVLDAMIQTAVDRATANIQHEAFALSSRLDTLEARIAVHEQSASLNHSEAFTQLAALDHHIAVLEARAV